MGIEGERAIVVAEVAGIEAAQQAIALYSEALPIGGGAAAVTPDAAERQAVMIIDQDRVGRLQRRLAQEPPAGVLQQRLGGDRVDALAHGGKAKIGAVGDQGGEQRTVMILGTRLVAGERLEGAREAATFVHVLQQVLDPHPRVAGLKRLAQPAQLR